MAGSRKGVPNKNKQSLLLRLRAELGHDYDPIISMAIIAHEKDDAGEYVHESTKRFDMHEKIAPYVTPRLKQIEHIGDDGPLTIQIIKFADQDVDSTDTE